VCASGQCMSGEEARKTVQRLDPWRGGGWVEDVCMAV
jgi:hypothetical protein